MLLLGPALGIFFNALIYLPMLLWLWRAPLSAARGAPAADRPAVRGLGDAIATLRSMRGNHIILTMTMLAGAASFFIGTAYQAQMPNFATDLGHGNAGLSYAALAAADAAGALCAAVMLESRGSAAAARTHGAAAVHALVRSAGAFALAHSYALSLAALFCAGFLELSFTAMAQALVQLNAPACPARPCHRRVRDGGARSALRQRLHRRHPGRGDRRARLAGAVGGGAIRGDRSAVRLAGDASERPKLRPAAAGPLETQTCEQLRAAEGEAQHARRVVVAYVDLRLLRS